MITSEAQPEAKTKLETARARTAIFEGEPILDKKLVMPNETRLHVGHPAERHAGDLGRGLG